MKKNELIKAIADAIDKHTNDLNNVEVMIYQLSDLIELLWDETSLVRDIEAIGGALSDAKDKGVENIEELSKTVYRFLAFRDNILQNSSSLAIAFDIKEDVLPLTESRKTIPVETLLASMKASRNSSEEDKIKN